MNTGSLENEALRYNLYGGFFLGEAEAWRPCFGGLAASEDDSLHRFGNVGKCILSKDVWKTDSHWEGKLFDLRDRNFSSTGLGSASSLRTVGKLTQQSQVAPPGVNTKFWGQQPLASSTVRCSPPPTTTTKRRSRRVCRTVRRGALCAAVF